MTLTPNRMTSTIAAIAARVARINTHAPRALANLHDAQPGIPATGGDGRRGTGHSDPTANLALGHDPARDTLDEIGALVHTLDTASARLDHLLRNWVGPTDKWRQALATEAALAVADHNWCAAHQQAGLLEPARTPGSRLCQRCQLDRGEIGADPPVWMIEKRHRGRSITTIDMARATREARQSAKGRKRKRR